MKVKLFISNPDSIRSPLAYRKKTSIEIPFILCSAPRGILKHSGADLQLSHGQSTGTQPKQCPVKVCVCRKRDCHCAALHSCTHPLLQFKSKPYILTEQFNQGKSQGNVLLPPPYLDWCVCKQRFLKGFICWILLTHGPFSPLCSNPLSSGAQLTLTTPFPHQAGNAWAFLLITYTDLRSKLDH